jgi:threonine/homoserine/homoserine lactone efflux protein
VIEQLAAFLPVVTLLCLVPGANNLLVLRTAAEVGPGAAGVTALGASAGIVAWSSAVALGVGELVSSVPGGLGTVGVAGSLAMVAMGLWALVPRRAAPVAERSSRGFATGLAVCLANPRTPVMAVSLLPQYAVATATTSSTVALGAVWAAVAMTWNLLCVTASRGRLTGSRGRVVQRAGGAVVAGLGALGVAQAV